MFLNEIEQKLPVRVGRLRIRPSNSPRRDCCPGPAFDTSILVATEQARTAFARLHAKEQVSSGVVLRADRLHIIVDFLVRC